MGMLLLFAVLMNPAGSERNVRSTDERILALIETGLTHSPTFQRLVQTLNDSDVIVYVKPRLTGHLGGYLAHNIVSTGAHRYLRVAMDIQGSTRRLVPLLAHELQHAIEVARDPNVRDPDALERLFRRLSASFGCSRTDCYETREATEIEHMVREELSKNRGRH